MREGLIHRIQHPLDLDGMCLNPAMLDPTQLLYGVSLGSFGTGRRSIGSSLSLSLLLSNHAAGECKNQATRPSPQRINRKKHLGEFLMLRVVPGSW